MKLIEKQPSITGPADWFTGAVYINPICSAEAPARLRAGLVRFTPGARTHWHSHSLGQTLHIVSGSALVGTRDGHVIEARPGDTVWTPPGEEHWHGATTDQFMAHLAMWEGDDVTWNEAVTDEDYQRAPCPCTEPEHLSYMKGPVSLMRSARSRPRPQRAARRASKPALLDRS